MNPDQTCNSQFGVANRHATPNPNVSDSLQVCLCDGYKALAYV